MEGIGLVSVSLITSLTLATNATQSAQTHHELPLKIDQVEQVQISETPAPTLPPVPDSYTVTLPMFVSQSYNNCGPAALSMILSLYGTYINQAVLAEKLRPYNNATGTFDDKSVFPEEFVNAAKEYGYHGLYRPNGNAELVKQLIAHDIPVVVRTWISLSDTTGHYRILKGYDEVSQEFIQDDSYQGPNRRYNYQTLEQMWEPFNNSYILIYPQEKQETVAKILGENLDETTAWRNALWQTQAVLKRTPDDPYAKLNQSIAYYHLGDYLQAVATYDKAKDQLPDKILWYVLEPLFAYQKVGNKNRVFEITDAILGNENTAYSELYQIRGEVYLQEGKKVEATKEFEQALYYNKHFTPAQKALENI